MRVACFCLSKFFFYTHIASSDTLLFVEKKSQSDGVVYSTHGRLEFGVTIFIGLNMDLHTAAKKGKLESIKLLVVEQGTDKDKENSHGHTPLYLASLYGHLEVVKYLVEQGASLDKANNSGNTPLSGAAHRGHLQVARYLLEQGADRDKADNHGYTPLHYAAQQDHLETAMLLMSYGADFNARTVDSELPIDLACSEEMKQAIRDEPRRRMDHGHKCIRQCIYIYILYICIGSFSGSGVTI